MLGTLIEADDRRCVRSFLADRDREHGPQNYAALPDRGIGRAGPVPNGYEFGEHAATDLVERNLFKEAMNRSRVTAAAFDRPVLEGGSMRRRPNASIRR